MNKKEDKEEGGRGVAEVSPILSKPTKEKETFSHEVENLHKGKRQTPWEEQVALIYNRRGRREEL